MVSPESVHLGRSARWMALEARVARLGRVDACAACGAGLVRTTGRPARCGACHETMFSCLGRWITRDVAARLRYQETYAIDDDEWEAAAQGLAAPPAEVAWRCVVARGDLWAQARFAHREKGARRRELEDEVGARLAA